MEAFRGQVRSGSQILCYDVEGYLVVNGPNEWSGAFRVSAWEPIEAQRVYRLEINDGRTGDIFIHTLRPDSLDRRQAEFRAAGPLT